MKAHIRFLRAYVATYGCLRDPVDQYLLCCAPVLSRYFERIKVGTNIRIELRRTPPRGKDFLMLDITEKGGGGIEVDIVGRPIFLSWWQVDILRRYMESTGGIGPVYVKLYTLEAV